MILVTIVIILVTIVIILVIIVIKNFAICICKNEITVMLSFRFVIMFLILRQYLNLGKLFFKWKYQ